jgi:amino acid transporter
MALILQGGGLAFYSFRGFEDMVNVAEETKHPERHLPKAILISLLVAAIFYGAVSISAVSVLTPAQLDASRAPLLDVVGAAAPGFPMWLFSVIALFAVTNTALVNFVMGSRLLFGMSQQRLLPAALGKVHTGRGTPDLAIAVIFAITMILSLALAKETLGGSTSLVLLTVFLLVNVSLVLLKFRDEATPRPGFSVPVVFPIAAAIACALLAFYVSMKSLLTVLILGPCGILLFLIYSMASKRARPPGAAGPPQEVDPRQQEDSP